MPLELVQWLTCCDIKQRNASRIERDRQKMCIPRERANPAYPLVGCQNQFLFWAGFGDVPTGEPPRMTDEQLFTRRRKAQRDTTNGKVRNDLRCVRVDNMHAVSQQNG